jgi:hypothetical protein
MTAEEREQRWAEAMRAERRGEAVVYECSSKKLRLPCVDRLRRASFAWASVRMKLKIWCRRYSSACTASGIPGIRHVRSCHGCTRSLATSSSTSCATADVIRDGVSICLLTIGSKWLPHRSTRPTAQYGRWIDRHLAVLPVGQRKVVRAIAVEGASVRSVAQELATSEGVVRMTLHRAINRLLEAADATPTIKPRSRNKA